MLLLLPISLTLSLLSFLETEWTEKKKDSYDGSAVVSTRFSNSVLQRCLQCSQLCTCFSLYENFAGLLDGWMKDRIALGRKEGTANFLVTLFFMTENRNRYMEQGTWRKSCETACPFANTYCVYTRRCVLCITSCTWYKQLDTRFPTAWNKEKC